MRAHCRRSWSPRLPELPLWFGLMATLSSLLAGFLLPTVVAFRPAFRPKLSGRAMSFRNGLDPPFLTIIFL